MSDALKESSDGSANGSPQRSEPEGHHASLVESLRQQLDHVRRELTEVKAERDEFKHYLYKLTEKKIEFDEEELLASVGTRQPLDEFLAELRKSLGV